MASGHKKSSRGGSFCVKPVKGLVLDKFLNEPVSVFADKGYEIHAVAQCRSVDGRSAVAVEAVSANQLSEHRGNGNFLNLS